MLKDKDLKRRCKQKIEWKDDHQLILDRLLTYVTEPPILAYPDFDLRRIRGRIGMWTFPNTGWFRYRSYWLW